MPYFSQSIKPVKSKNILSILKKDLFSAILRSEQYEQRERARVPREVNGASELLLPEGTDATAACGARAPDKSPEL